MTELGAERVADSARGDTRARVQRLLVEVFASKGVEFEVARPLRDQDFDSLDTVALLSELEQAFDITIDQVDLDEANFLDLESLTGLMLRKCAGAGVSSVSS